MRILLIVILLSFMTGCLSSFKVTGYSGGTVIISCHYSTEDRSHDKYFCLGQYSYSLRCEDQIRTGLNNTWKHSGRFSLYDNTGGKYFKVIIRQLTRQDEGTYWCGVNKPTLLDSYTNVELEVKKDDCCVKSVTETAFLGGEATIRCNYPEDHEDRIKYFCKEQDRFICNSMNSKNNKISNIVQRFSVSDNRGERFSTVTISDLTEDDTGTYWCGVETSRTEQRYITLITQVKLRVITTPTTMSTTATTTTALQASATTTFISQSSSPSSSSSSSSSPSSTSSSSSSSSLNGSGTSVVIMVSVSLVVLLLVISLIIVYRWKYTKITGPVSSTHRVSPDTGNHEGGCHGDGEYEEIMERPLQSDSTIYATSNLTTSHFDSPHYASITFHKTPSCPNEARVTTAKEGTSSCDYATVNFGQSPTYSTVNHPHCSSENPPI